MYQFNRFVRAFTPPANPTEPQGTASAFYHGKAYAFQAEGLPRYRQSPGVVAGVGYSLPNVQAQQPALAMPTQPDDTFILVTHRCPSIGYQTAVYNKQTGTQLGVFHPWWGWQHPKQPVHKPHNANPDKSTPNNGLPVSPTLVKRLMEDIEAHHTSIAQPRLHKGQFISTSHYRYPHPERYNGYYYGQKVATLPTPCTNLQGS